MVIIEGVTGVGKSTLQRELCHKISNACMLVQDYEHNICLKDFYQGDSCIFQKQMIFLFSDYHVLISAIRRNPYKIIVSDFSLERSEIMAKSNMSEYEYESLFSPCYEYLMKPFRDVRKMLILLYSSPEHIIENIKRRNRSMEQGIQQKYIHEKQELLMKELPEYPFNKVIKINCDYENILDECLIEKLNREIQCFETKE